MKRRYAVLILCMILGVPGLIYAQISGPTTGAVGTPISFSTPQGGVSYNWSFETTNRNLNVTYTPVVVNAVSLPISPNYTSMVFDGTNWYSFTISATSAQIIRANYGTNPTVGNPTLTTLTTTVSTVAGNVTKGMDVVYDSTDKRWYAVVVSGWVNGVQILDFGPTGLSNNAPTLTVVPTAANHVVTNQLTMKRWNGQWLCFVGGSSNQYFTRYDLGANLGALSASSPALTARALGNINIFNFSLYEEAGNWYAIGADLSTIYRFTFGNNLQNNSPTVTVLNSSISPSVTGNFRSVMLARGCNNQLFGFLGTGTPNTHKLNFNGNIASTSISSTPMVATGGGVGTDGTAGLCAFVYNDTLYAAGSRWNSGNAVFIMKLLPLTNSKTQYRDKTISHTFTAPGTYKVDLLIDAGAKSGSQAYCHEIVITASGPAQPDPYTAAPTSVCAGQTGVAYSVPPVSGATGYRWQYTGSNTTYSGATTQPTNNLSFQANATSGTLKVWAVNSNGDSSTNSRDVAVSVKATPVVTVSGGSPVCVGGTRVLGGTPAGGTWSTGSPSVATVSSNGTVTGVAAGTAVITYSYTDANSCSDKATESITVNALPKVAISPATVTICNGQSTTLTASGATTYNWSHGGSAAATTVSPTATTTYTVTGTTSGCSATATRQVAVTPLPNVSISPATSSICAGERATLTASGATTYSWSHGGSTAATTVSPTATTTYTVTGTSSGCSTTASRQVTVHSLPVTQITVTGGITDVCVGDSVVLTASGSGYNYQWKNGASVAGSGNRHAVRSTGSYKVIATDPGSGCSDSTQAVDVRVYDRPVVTIDHNDTSFCEGGVIRLEVNTLDTGLAYVWQQDGASVAQATAFFLEVSETGVYRVLVERSGIAGCGDSTNAVRVTVHDLPVVHTVWDGELLHATPGFMSYQWHIGGQGMAGANDSIYRPTENAGYSVTVVDSNGCEQTSAVQNLTNVSVSGLSGVTDIKVYPNPSDGMVYIEWTAEVGVDVVSVDGRVLSQLRGVRKVDLRNYASGVYLLRIQDATGMVIGMERVVKQ